MAANTFLTRPSLGRGADGVGWRRVSAHVTANPTSVTRRRMPKEKLPEVMPVRFREGTFAKIDGVAGENRRAAFIRDAVEEALKRAARKPAKG